MTSPGNDNSNQQQSNQQQSNQNQQTQGGQTNPPAVPQSQPQHQSPPQVVNHQPTPQQLDVMSGITNTLNSVATTIAGLPEQVANAVREASPTPPPAQSDQSGQQQSAQSGQQQSAQSGQQQQQPKPEPPKAGRVADWWFKR